jgi:hypothetical protein
VAPNIHRPVTLVGGGAPSALQRSCAVAKRRLGPTDQCPSMVRETERPATPTDYYDINDVVLFAKCVVRSNMPCFLDTGPFGKLLTAVDHGSLPPLCCRNRC